MHIDCHLTLPWYLNINEANIETDALFEIVKQEFSESMELFVHADGCDEFSCRICSKEICTVRKHPFEK